ncbi:MAG: SDR family oxidoreductase [Candidatus Thiosymbion ectosymbiont of Robbea hypermnestra]|nr:SDR family oxidoreductase [Candidatus Thiosymbion ectosymbiont of Robbea hypermnestra]
MIADANGDPARRLILITGASRGIGRALSLKLLDGGSRVVGIGRDFSQWSLPRTGFEAITADLAELDGLPGLLSGIVKAHPELDAVVSNAGAGRFGHLEQFSPRQVRASVDLNLTQHILVARAFLPLLKRRGRADLIFMGSETALAGGIKGAVYSACKSALRGLARSLRQECAAGGVRVGIVNPGPVRTGFFDGLAFRPGAAPENAIAPEDVADAVIAMLGAPPGTVVDEINLSPLKKVLRFDPPAGR